VIIGYRLGNAIDEEFIASKGYFPENKKEPSNVCCAKAHFFCLGGTISMRFERSLVLLYANKQLVRLGGKMWHQIL